MEIVMTQVLMGSDGEKLTLDELLRILDAIEEGAGAFEVEFETDEYLHEKVLKIDVDGVTKKVTIYIE